MISTATVAFIAYIIMLSATTSEDIKCDIKLEDQTIPRVCSEPLMVSIGNLDYDTKRAELSNHFGKYGEVIDLFMPPNAMDEMKNAGYCFVTYADARVAIKVLDAEHVIDGVRLHVQLHDRAELTALTTLYTVFVGNLDHDMKREELSDYFREFGEVIDLSMPLNIRDWKNSGYCFVIYDDIKSIDRVLGIRHVFKGRILNVQLHSKNDTPYTAFTGRSDHNPTGEELSNRPKIFGEMTDRPVLPSPMNKKKDKGSCSVNEARETKPAVKDGALDVKPHDKTKPMTQNTSRIVFVRNLYPDMSRKEKNELIDYFEAFGKVTTLSIPHNPIDKTKNKGFCFVTYADIEVADRFLETKHIINSRTLDVQPYDKNKSKVCNMFSGLFVGNLDHDMKREELLKHFSRFGEVIDISMPPNPMNKSKPYGYCFITYADADVTKRVLRRDHIINNRVLDVQRYDKTKFSPKNVFSGLFIRNLNRNMRKNELLDYFDRFGEIKYCSMPLNPEDRTKNNGYCFVTYADMKAANEVLRTKHTFKGRTLSVKPYNINNSRIHNTSCTVFVGKLSYDMNEREKKKLLEHFEAFGEVIDITIPSNSMDGRKNRGCCFVTYANVEAANKSLRANHIVSNRSLCVQPIDNNKPSVREPPCKVFVGNLDCDMNEKKKHKLLEHFGKFGKVIDITISPNLKDKTKSNRYCFVTYANMEAVDKSLKASHIVNDRILRVQLAGNNKFKACEMPCTVFVRNPRSNMNEEDLLRHFRKFGEISSLSTLPRTANKTKNMSYCFVTYSNVEAADKAIKAVHIIRGWTLDVKPYDNAKLKIYDILCIVFIENLDPNMKKDELLNHFCKFGELNSLSMPLDAIDKTKNSGYCFVTYFDAEAADRVLDTVHTLNNRTLDVQRCSAARLMIHNTLCTVFVGNLRSNMNEDDLIDYFGTFGEIIDISMPPDAVDKTKNTGVCFITYADVEAVDKALETEHILKGRNLCVQPYDKNNRRCYKRSNDAFYREDYYYDVKRRKI